MREPATLVLAPTDITVPASGPRGFLGDRIQQLPAVRALCAGSRSVLLWPDDAVTRTLFAFPNLQLVAGKVSHENITEIYGLYTPVTAPAQQQDMTCRQLHAADAIIRNLTGIKVHQLARLDPRGATPIWRQLLDQLGLGSAVPPLPWLNPGKSATAWAAGIASRAIILSPFSGTAKQAVTDEWWQELFRRIPAIPIVVPVHGKFELGEARYLFAGTATVVIEADLAQTIALGALPQVTILGVDGGRLSLLAASRRDPVYAFYGRWPASAWALPNVQPLPRNSTPEQVINQIGIR